MSLRPTNKFLLAAREKGWDVNGYRSSSDQVITHLLLDGGKLSVPDKDLESFHRLYSKCVTCQNLFVVEVKQSKFKMFLDIDIKPEWMPEQYSTKAVALQIVKTARRASSAYSGVESPYMVVCNRVTSGAHRRNDDQKEKFGMHIVWPNWVVCKADALMFRSSLLKELYIDELIADSKDLLKNLDSIVDAAVFKGSGLRMIGSKKINSDNIYLPCLSFTQGTEDAEVIKNPWGDLDKWVSDTSIHVIPEEIIANVRSSTSSLSPSPETRSPLIFDKTDESDERGILFNTYQSSMQNIRISPAIQDTLHAIKTMVPCYSKAKITAVYRAKTGKEAVFILGTDSKFCTNLAKNRGLHKSNHVYLLLRQSGLYQRCFCQCDTLDGRKYKQCKEFEGKLIGFTSSKSNSFSTMLALAST